MNSTHKHFGALTTLAERVNHLKSEIAKLEVAIGQTTAIGKQYNCRLDTMAAEDILSTWRKDTIHYAHTEISQILTEGRSISFLESLSRPTNKPADDLRNWDAFKLAERFERQHGTAEDAERQEALTNIKNFIVHCKPVISPDAVLLSIPFYHLEAEYSCMKKNSGQVRLGYSDSAIKTLDTIMAFFRLVQAIATNRSYAATQANFPIEWQEIRQRSAVSSRALYKRFNITGNNYARIMASRSVQFWMEPSVWLSMQAMLPKS